MGAMPGNRKERRSNRVKGLAEVPGHIQKEKAERQDFFQRKSEMRKFSTSGSKACKQKGS